MNRLLALALTALLFASPAAAQIDGNFTAGGGIRVGTSVTACSGAVEGAIRYEATADVIEYCNGATSNWTSLGGLPAAGSLDFTEFKDAMALDASTSIMADGTEVLSITNTGTANSFVVNDQAGDATPFVIAADGKVGIMTAPTYDLDVAGTLRTADTLYACSTTVDDAAHTSISIAPCDSNLYSGIETYGARGGGTSLAAYHHFYNNSTRIGDLEIYTGTNATSGTIILSTANSGAMAAHLRITQTGNVGIGAQTAVDDKFHIAGGQLRIDNDTNTTNKGCIRYDGTGNKLQFSHDCTSFSDMGSGGSSFPLLANPVGSATAPAYSFNADGNTGMYAATADKLSFATGGTERIRITSTGMSINQAADPSAALDVTGDIEFSGVLIDTSDIRLKTDVLPLGSSLAKVSALEPISFRMKGDRGGRVEYGFSAQDVRRIYPDLVVSSGGAQETLSLNYLGFIAPMVEAIKELKAESEQLEAENEDLKSTNKALLRRIEAIERELAMQQ